MPFSEDTESKLGHKHSKFSSTEKYFSLFVYQLNATGIYFINISSLLKSLNKFGCFTQMRFTAFSRMIPRLRLSHGLLSIHHVMQ